MGLVIFGAMGLYLLLAILIVRWAIRHARKTGMNPVRWGWSAALVMYLIPFWDWLPTVAIHRYYCATEAGFWIYKTLNQWTAENPGVTDTLTDNSPHEKFPNWPLEDWNGKKITGINQRFGIEHSDHLSGSRDGELFMNIWRWQTDLLDKKTGEVLARQVDFSAGNNGYIGGMHSLKFWLQSDTCFSDKQDSRNFVELLQQFRGARR